MPICNIQAFLCCSLFQSILLVFFRSSSYCPHVKMESFLANIFAKKHKCIFRQQFIIQKLTNAISCPRRIPPAQFSRTQFSGILAVIFAMIFSVINSHVFLSPGWPVLKPARAVKRSRTPSIISPAQRGMHFKNCTGYLYSRKEEISIQKILSQI